MSEPRQPSPVDVHVGNRLRAARNMASISQDAAGKAVDLTFQQIQKYEKGSNRTSASRLVQFAILYGVRVEWFFEGAPGYESAGLEGGDIVAGFFALPYACDIAADFAKIAHNADRDVVRSVTHALAGRNGGA